MHKPSLAYASFSCYYKDTTFILHLIFVHFLSIIYFCIDNTSATVWRTLVIPLQKNLKL